jgi:hypothetical protein
MNEIITNSTEIKQRILSEINNANQSIYIAMAYFTDRDIAMAIVGAKNRNVIIDVILSSDIRNETVKLMLKGANVIVHAFETGDTRGIMHHKFCLIDDKITINGSYNYSINASNNNVENIHISDDFSTFSQFLSEFDRLKYNIENQIAVNTPNEVVESIPQQIQQVNIIDAFSQQLHNLLYSSAEINTDEYRKQGYETSKKCHGSISIFQTEFNNIVEEIKALTTDESLSNKKSILTSNISNAFESAKMDLELEKIERIKIANKDNELEKRQTLDQISDIQNEKSILESGNPTTGTKGLLELNKEIEKNKLERKSLEQSLIVKKFWTFGNSVVTFFLFIFSVYLLVFFASALYKMLFEDDVIRKSLEAGVNPGLPKLVDANAIIKIFRQEGMLFGFIGMIFFLFPILLSNVKLLGSERKWLNDLLFWVGLLVFDIVVAGMIAINTDEIKSLLVGKESQLAFWEVIKKGEFYMIFMFGMVPLIITHYLIENITIAYRNSKSELVDSEKARKIQILDGEMIELNFEKETIENKSKEMIDTISEYKTKIIRLETEINDIQNKLENRYSELHKQIKLIFDNFNARVISGRIFTDLILDSVITAYKSGFIEYLPDYYATDEVTIRVQEIEKIKIG